MLIKTFLVLFAALFLSAQGFTKAAAAAHDCHDHSHDSVICDVSLTTAHQNVVVPPPPITIPFSPPVEAHWDIVCLNDLSNSFDSRAPPPRGPPAR